MTPNADDRQDDWRAHAAELADRLTEQGTITDPAWRQVVRTVPRHVFVPEFYSEDDPPKLLTADDPRWLGLAYSDDTLVTQRKEHPDHPGFAWSTSSSTRPSLMLRMLELLDVREGLTVLEIGTGTGYNAALLSERLGSEHVTTVDIDPRLTAAARLRLAGVGYSPSVAAGDGPRGYPARAAYDRIIATVATERVPYPWVEQTRPGGIILADIRPRGMTWAGALARLTVGNDGTASGPLVSCIWGFMSTRSDVERPGIPEGGRHRRVHQAHPYKRDRQRGAADRWAGLADLAAPSRHQRVPWSRWNPDHHPDGSWATVAKTAPAEVVYGGPADIWKEAEHAHTWWTEHGSPSVETFGLTVGPGNQRLWHETPDGECCAAPGRP